MAFAPFRSAEAVQERLDRLIQEIYKLQTPHMDGKSGKPADVLIVSLIFVFSHSSSFHVSIYT